MKNPKTINSLMAYMRKSKGMKIEGSTQKRKLRYMGYFHGYKGYRFYGKPTNLFNYTTFNELQAVYSFDMELKTLMYPKIMFLETTTKNYALEVILKSANSRRFADIYSKLLTNYKSFPIGNSDYKKAISKRLTLRNKVYSAISRDYGNRFVVNHYYDKDLPLPIWAIFEIISLGEFAMFIACLDQTTRKEISKQVGIKSSVDSDGKMLPDTILTLKDLRNAVAHNNTIFDTRFKTSGINSRIAKYIESETGIKQITFNTIVDYVILISFLLKLLKCPKSEIAAFVKDFENIIEVFRKSISISIYSAVVYTDTRNKLTLLKKWL